MLKIWGLLVFVVSASTHANKTLKNLALYHCAQEVYKISKSASPDSGKIFGRDQIMFSSTELDVKVGSQQKRVKRLIVFTETKSFEYALPEQGIANLMIDVPSADPRLKPRTYFIRYYHSNVTSNRTFGFSTWKQPNGPRQFEFKKVNPIKESVTDLNQRMLYSINDQLEDIMGNVKLGYLSSEDLLAGNVSICKDVLPEYKRVISLINHKLNQVSFMSPKGVRVRPKNFDRVDLLSSRRWPASR